MKSNQWGLWLLGAVLALIGLALGLGGVKLLGLGGSPYYLLAGLACFFAGILIGRGKPAGLTLYFAFFLLTTVWALWEAGLDFWQLVPRLAVFLALAVYMLAPWVQGAIQAEGRKKAPVLQVVIAAIGILALGAAAMTSNGTHLANATDTPAGVPDKSATDWREFGQTSYGDRYSPSNQITPQNVAQLKPAWIYHTGDTMANYPNTKSAFMFEVTPIKVDETLYLCTPHNIIIALDAATGKERWRHDPKVNDSGVAMMVCRGVSYYETRDKTLDCPKRILEATIDGRMIAVDAATGARCQSFGNHGEVNLREGMGQFEPGFQYTTSPPSIVGDVAVVGGFVLDGENVHEPSGVIRGFDARNGKLVWAWDMGRPDTGPLKPGETYTQSTPNAWTPFSADPALGLVYAPTGNRTPDYWGVDRTAADDMYSSSVVALDAATGKVRWHFQTVHHDLWDYDVGSQPVLVDFPVAGGTRPALIQPTKHGEIYVLDRATGAPLTPVEERPSPKGDVPGERYSPTQPWSVGMPSFTPPPLRERDMWGTTPFDQMLCRIQFKSLRYDGKFTLPSTTPTLEYPGTFGIIDWGSVAVDTGRDIMVVNTSGMPFSIQLVPRAEFDARKAGKAPKSGHWGSAPQYGAPYAVDFGPLMSKLGFPCAPPPWGMLYGVDLKTRKIVWSNTLGTTQDIAPFGISVSGGYNIGGAAVTRGGVTFIGATIDNYLRAFDTRTGKELWKGRLPAGPQAGAMTYTDGKTGKQYVVIAAGGHPFMQTKHGDAIVAFALPD
ncbi:MAG TPA: membrane-bound PQQ-dependent dehydrogenase, glucose/quinate/shikimate family [Rhodocyclaceae bacterium]|nr:membrane-bound PQQ-dependent dehydrogenase, glucose/quinate/shikimate family [Rhodocyclaceae bacterium]